MEIETLIVVVLAVLVIAAVTILGPKFGVAAPLLLVVIGIGVSFLPFVPALEIEPEWILAGLLPPLLYSASVSLPAMDFRREFNAIGGLSVVLVIATSVILGVVFAALIPGLGLAWGIALGAIVSPTDAVATSIVKRLNVAPRAVAILEGESLLNDATALVLLRSAIAGAAASISLWEVAGAFLFAVVVAIVIGFAIGHANLWVRSRVKDPTVNTVLSFTVPFLASIPAELLGASGLVAAVVAGLVTGRLAPRMLPARHRLSDSQNWRTVEFLLEGAIFLLMGLQVYGIVVAVQEDEEGLMLAGGLAAVALLLTIAVRAAYVAPLLIALKRRADRRARLRTRLESLQEQFDDPAAAVGPMPRAGRGRGRSFSPGQLERFMTRVRRMVADMDYFLAAPLGWREGTVVVWAGMRGAVTLAAAQTLPVETPHRSLLVLVAFLVAAASLLLQGGTLGSLIRFVKPARPDPAAVLAERTRLMNLLGALNVASAATPVGPGGKARAIAVIEAQREALLRARDDGTFGAELLESALINLDADQISLELKGSPDDQLDGTVPPAN